jgi:hypothetical protein
VEALQKALSGCVDFRGVAFFRQKFYEWLHQWHCFTFGTSAKGMSDCVDFGRDLLFPKSFANSMSDGVALPWELCQMH